MRRTGCKTSAELRAMPFLASHNYETNEDLSKGVVEYVSEFKKLKDLIFRFGPKPFLNYVKDLQSSQQDETFKILAAAIKIEESWIPWFWIKDMELVCENEFSFVYTARIKPPFIGSRTSGKKVHLRQVKDQNIALKIYPQTIENNYISDHFAITFDQEHGFAHFIAWSGHVADAEAMPLLEYEIGTQFKGWVRTLTVLNSMVHSITFQGLDKPGCHGQLHPKNIWLTHPSCTYFYAAKQFIWQRAVRECHTDIVYGRLPYLAPEIITTDARPNLKGDAYAFDIIMWQMVSRSPFSPDQYLEREVYRIDRVPGVPEWYEALYLECLDKDRSNRPELKYVQDMMKSKTADPYAVRDGYDTGLTDVDPKLLKYQSMRAEKIKAHLEEKPAPTDILEHSTSRVYTRQEILNEVGCNLVSL